MNRRLRNSLPWLACPAVLALAASRAWVCDDAYISFRYADNLARGLGLVFNEGERVEGFTNLSWTLYSALGHGLGIGAELWAHVGSLLAFLGILVLLARAPGDGPSLAPAGVRVPVAVLLAAMIAHVLDFATSGLETSLFTFLALAGYRSLFPASGDGPSPRRAALGGAILAFACLTRPDGVIFAVVLLPALALQGRIRPAAFAILAFLALWVPTTAWRILYYGDFFPNTYYAKSASTAWWSQGLFYVRVFFVRYWPLGLSVPLCAWALLRRKDGRRPLLAPVLIESALVLAYTLYVARVGGDFMFGRLLVPVVPFLLLLFDRGIRHVFARAPFLGLGFVAAAMAFLATGRNTVAQGINDERSFYTSDDWARQMDDWGDVLRGYFDNADVRVCYFGSEARLIYRSRVRVAIECETGLTDRHVARQPLAGRGRVGHEKHATPDYVLDTRGVRFLFKLPWGPQILGIEGNIPEVPIQFGPVPARVLTWDASMMATLRARGVSVPDLSTQLDVLIERLPRMPPEEARRTAEGIRRLYLNHTHDPVRTAALTAALRPQFKLKRTGIDARI